MKKGVSRMPDALKGHPSSYHKWYPSRSNAWLSSNKTLERMSQKKIIKPLNSILMREMSLKCSMRLCLQFEFIHLNRCQRIIVSLFNVSINDSYYKFRKRINCSFFSESYFISILWIWSQIFVNWIQNRDK